MESMPKIVLDRLKAAKPAPAHPAADTLNAFAEHSLAGRERAAVLEHLAGCGDCREIVALSLPEIDAAGPVVVPARSGWLTWPALRWGVVAAGVAIIAVFAAVQYRPVRPSQIASNEAPVLAVDERKAEAPAPVASPVASSASAALLKSDSAVKDSAPRAEAVIKPEWKATQSGGARSRSARSAAAGIGSGPKPPSLQNYLANQQQMNQANQASTSQVEMAQLTQAQANKLQANQPAAMPGEAAGNLKSFGGTFGGPLAKISPAVPPPAPTIPREQSATAPAAPAPALDGYTSVAKAKTVITTEEGSDSLQRPVMSLMNHGDKSLPMWSVSPEGRLQRSDDHGATYQNVDLAASPAVFGSGMVSRDVTAELRKEAATSDKSNAPARVKEADKKAFAINGLPSLAPVIRAVSSNGKDVWAGGVGGALYHSSDAGAHWARVIPTISGTVLTTDIVSVEFADLLSGTVMTANGEVWITADAGLTWTKK